MYSYKDITEAHAYSIYHREDIEKSYYCGCFYCTKIFRPFQINFWIDNNDTAVCPFCGIDSIIGDYSGYPITEEFLKAMNERWF
ncbi:MAG: cytoplasmic protein [Ruminococcus sp.]|nr:cytoplasmic protein [Ruminococcus sp.]MDE7104463.1 cytoplasmic protein [Ruminococcus sp.]